MSIEERKFELMDDYLAGNLEGSVKEDFEKLLDHDDELKNSFADHQLIVEGIRYTGRNDMLAELKRIESNATKEEETTHKSKKGYLYMGIAAAVLLLIVAFLTLKISYTSDYQALVEDYYEPYPSVYSPVTRSSVESLTDLEKAMQFYEAGDYQEAISIFESLDMNENEELITFYTANAYLAVNDYPKGEAYYLEIVDEGEIFATQARWYLALSFLKRGETGSAIEHLEQLENTDYADKANELIESINK